MAILASVRAACLPGLWSQGVKLAREGAVSLEKRSGSEITCRVRESGKPVAPTVTLYVDDDEWTCDCDGTHDPCAHVAAATIAVSQGDLAAPTAPTSSGGEGTSSGAGLATPSARIRYAFTRTSGVLALVRTIIDASGKEQPVSQSLAARPPLGFLPTHEDLVVDRIMLAAPQRLVPLARLTDVFLALANPPPSTQLTLDGSPIRLSGAPIFPIISVEDERRGVALRMRRDPSIAEVVARGVVRADDTLHPVGAPELTGDRLEKLPAERLFEKAELGELVARVIPELERTMTVQIASKRLPKAGARVGPRLHFELSHETHTLSVMPLIVYGDPPQARIDGDKLVHLRGPVPERSPAAERALVHALRDQLNLVPGRRVDFDGHAASTFAEKLRAFQKRVSGAAERDTFEDRALVPRFVIDGDRFDVLFEIESGDDDDRETRRADPGAVLRAFHDRLSLVPLLDGGWAPLPTDWLARFGRPLADLLAARGDDKKIPRAILPELARFCDDIGAPRPEGLERLRPLIEGLPALPDAPPPIDLRADLRPYQQVGVSWLSFLRDAQLGAILADDMGLGKTLQTIAVLSGRCLVVCPRSVVHNWENELRRFRPNLRVATYHGPKRALDPTADVTLTTYAVLRLDIAPLTAIEWDTVVLDEAQTIKNPDSQAAQAAYDLRSKFRVALSGTPIENRLDELWSLFHFTNRGLLGGRRHFVDAYGGMNTGDPGAAGRLHRRIGPFLLRRRKRDVAPELPPRTEAVLDVELEDDERTLYDAVKAATRKDVLAALANGGSVLQALEVLLRLRQAACHPALLPGQRAEGSSKTTRLVEALEEAALGGHKALVFSQWTSFLDLVEPHLEARGIRFTRLDGSTNDRAAVVDAFQAADGPPVLLLSLKAGGTGLNLTAADHVFLLDPWWNPAVEDQAADRAHRIGQDKPVMVYRLVARGTVEEGIVALQEKKRGLAEAALSGSASAGGLTRDDLLDLLNV